MSELNDAIGRILREHAKDIREGLVSRGGFLHWLTRPRWRGYGYTPLTRWDRARIRWTLFWRRLRGNR
jgi:hypothetical protein